MLSYSICSYPGPNNPACHQSMLVCLLLSRFNPSCKRKSMLPCLLISRSKPSCRPSLQDQMYLHVQGPSPCMAASLSVYAREPPSYQVSLLVLISLPDIEPRVKLEESHLISEQDWIALLIWTFGCLSRTSLHNDYNLIGNRRIWSYQDKDMTTGRRCIAISLICDCMWIEKKVCFS